MHCLPNLMTKILTWKGLSGTCVGWVKVWAPDHVEKAAVTVPACLGWISLSGWFPQSSARTLQLGSELWHHLCWYNQWFVFWTWTAMLFLGSPRLTACLSSLSLTFSVPLVSFTCKSGESQGVSYTTPVCFCSWVLSSFALGFFSWKESSLVWRQA